MASLESDAMVTWGLAYRGMVGQTLTGNGDGHSNRAWKHGSGGRLIARCNGGAIEYMNKGSHDMCISA